MDYSLLLGVHYRAPQHLQTGVSFRQSLTADGLTILSEGGNHCVLSNKLLHLFYAYKLLLLSQGLKFKLFIVSEKSASH